MPHRDDLVMKVLRDFAPAWAEALGDDVALGPEGLGFDSVRIVELLLALEDRLGVAFPAEAFAGRPLTVGALRAHARGATPP